MNDHRDGEDERECVFVPEEGGSLILVSIGTPLYLVAFIPCVCVPYRDICIYMVHM